MRDYEFWQDQKVKEFTVDLVKRKQQEVVEKLKGAQTSTTGIEQSKTILT